MRTWIMARLRHGAGSRSCTLATSRTCCSGKAYSCGEALASVPVRPCMHGMLRAGRTLTEQLSLAVGFPCRVCSACPTASSTPTALVRAGAGEGHELHAHAHEPADAPPGEGGTTPACPHLIDIPVPRHLIDTESLPTRDVHDEPQCRYPSTPTMFASK